MLDVRVLARSVRAISDLMTANRDYLVSLDQVNGDGDLGISMDDGFRALAEFLEERAGQVGSAADGATDLIDLGRLLRDGARVFNEAAPSSLGTILTFGLMGMARALRGRTEVDFPDAAAAAKAGLDNLMAKAGSKPGEKTIVDALAPAVAVLGDGVGSGEAGAAGPADNRAARLALLEAAAQAAADGSEATREMEAVHGRAAYSAARSIGVLDGGSVVGRLIAQGVREAAAGFSKAGATG